MNYESMSTAELKDLAKENGLKNISKFKKDDLIAILKEMNNSSNPLQDNENKQPFNEVTTSEGYKLTNEGDEVVSGILEVLPDGYRFFKR